MRVKLNGEVISDDWQWIYDYFKIPAFSPQVVRNAVDTTPEGEDLTLEINSVGGSVFAGFEIYTILRQAERTRNLHSVAEVQSLAASAASTIMVGCSAAMLSPVAQVMIHLPSTYTDGDINAHKRSERTLDSIAQSILNGYELKCGAKVTRARLEHMMENESWICAQDAVEMGLADGILYDEEGVLLPANVINAVGGGIRSLVNSASGLNSPEELLARYEQAVRNGAPAAEGHPVDGAPTMQESRPHEPAGTEPANDTEAWHRRAAIDLETLRF